MTRPYYPRFAEPRVRTAIQDTRVVLLSGPRQAGKTTLAKHLAGHQMGSEDLMSLTTESGNILTTEAPVFYTFDDVTSVTAAKADPVGFIRGIDRAIIDEVQRVPELLIAIKESVDIDPRPGRFLLTGSADLLSIPRVADSLAGRMEVVKLLPLAQSELRGTLPGFLTSAFEGVVLGGRDFVIGDALVETVLAGGYPEALMRTSESRRQAWYLAYSDAIVQRDVRDVAHVDNLGQVGRLLPVLAHHSGQLLNYSKFSAALGITHPTARKYVEIFERLFLVSTLPPWHTNALKRLIKTPKLHFLDTGLLSALLDVGMDRVRSDRSLFGPILESFVFAELRKLATAEGQRFNFYHYRDKDGDEVDIVIEDTRGRIVGIEVKAAATVRTSDFRGMQKLAAACGPRFVMGVVLYDHDQIVPFGKNMFAAPISTLWNKSSEP